MDDKFCINCKHCNINRTSGNYITYNCSQGEEIPFDLVTGLPCTEHFIECVRKRNLDCGYEAKLYETKI